MTLLLPTTPLPPRRLFLTPPLFGLVPAPLSVLPCAQLGGRADEEADGKGSQEPRVGGILIRW